MEKFEQQKRYERAQKRVKDEKGFYSHLTVYIIINIFLLFINTDFINQGFSQWTQWHIYFTPFFWGIGLFFHWIKVFNPNIVFSKQWEERKIKEIMDQDDRDNFF